MENKQILNGEQITENVGDKNKNKTDEVPAINTLPVYKPDVANAEIKLNELRDNGNIAKGIAGAFLFSLIGGVAYFIFYQIGFIVALTGVITYIVALLGYSLFSKAKSDNPRIGIVSAAIITIIILYLSEYVSVSFEFYKIIKSYGYSFWYALQKTGDLIGSSSEIHSGVVEDLTYSYTIFAIVVIVNIIKVWREKKKWKNMLKEK